MLAVRINTVMRLRSDASLIALIEEIVQLILGHEKIPTLGGDFSRQVIRAAESAIPREAFPLVLQPELLTPDNEET